jgi:molecular chaperone HtpG
LSVHTENLFPIIKKWLYSEHDIFLRELVSNAVDATTKFSRLADLGEYKGNVPAPVVNIKINKTDKTVTISDNGLGMTADEIKQYINQIAFSGATDFLEKYKNVSTDQGSQIIGHFGMGFFSSFMVSSLVEINTLSFREGSAPVKWSCDGSTDFSMEAGTKTDIGTDIVLHLNAESEEFLDEEKLKELVVKYSDFLPAEIQVNGKKANSQKAPWNEAPSKLTDEDYKNFYQKLFPGQEDPLFHVHFSVDYPFNLKGILYFPRIKTDFEIKTQGRLRLFCNNVFVSDHIEGLMPPFLHLLQGVLDSPDIPLNVSRSFLQGDPQVKKIATHVIAKVAEKLSQLFKNERENFTKYWEDIHPFIKYGALSDDKFYDKVKDTFLLKLAGGTVKSLAEYKESNPKLKDRVIYANHADAQHTQIERIKTFGVEVAILDSPIDNHFMQTLEMKMSPLRFMRVDSDIPEHLIEDSKGKNEETKEEKELSSLFQKHLGLKSMDLRIENLPSQKLPAIMIQSEMMRRMGEMSSMMQGKMGDSFIQPTLVVNSAHPLFTKLQLLSTVPEKEAELKEQMQNAYDLARLEQGTLKGEALSGFISRVSGLLTGQNEVKG